MKKWENTEKVRKGNVKSPVCCHRESATVNFGGISFQIFFENIQIGTGMVLYEIQCFIISFSLNAIS